MTIRYRMETRENFQRDLRDDEDLPDKRAYVIKGGSELHCDPRKLKKKRVMPTHDVTPRPEQRAKLAMLQTAPLPPPLAALWAYLWQESYLVTGTILRFWLNENSAQPMAWFVDKIMQGSVLFTINKYGLELIRGLQRVPYTVMRTQKIAPLAHACLPPERRKEGAPVIWEDQSLQRKATIQQLATCPWNERLANELPRFRILVIFTIITNTDELLPSLRCHSEDPAYSLETRIAILRLCDTLGCSREEERFANLLQYLH